jgi:hypothetical protein
VGVRAESILRSFGGDRVGFELREVFEWCGELKDTARPVVQDVLELAELWTLTLVRAMNTFRTSLEVLTLGVVLAVLARSLFPVLEP